MPGSTSARVFLLCCVLTGAADEDPNSQTLRFETTVPALERLREWLREQGVTYVAKFTVVLANSEEVKNRKGHKTDRNDAKH